MVVLFSVPLFRLGYTVLIIALLSVPLLIAYLIANDPAFDPRRLLVRSIPYALLTGVLAALYLGLVLVAQRLFAQATGEEAIWFNVAAAVIVAFAFAPLRERLQRGLDRLYGRDPMALRLALDQAGSELLGALDRDEVRGAVESAIARGLKRPVRIDWPATGMPRLAEPDELREEERSAIESLLLQAGIRLENLALQTERAAAERRAVELREAAARAELRALHAQVQPHFLFNALNALSYLTETDPAAAQRFTERLADMLRYTVAAGDRPAALLSEEIAFVEDYLAVARERYENPLVFEYRGAPELLSAAVPPLLLQPLVENSLKHGCLPGDRPLHLVLEAETTDGFLSLKFRDDGGPSRNGMPGLGVGLQNLEQRVRRFGGGESSMSAGPDPSGGYAVAVRWRLSSEAAA
jgi:signal transduction histidine kinase